MNNHKLLVWYANTFLQYLKLSRRSVKRINKLINSIYVNGFSNGIGKPELLKHKENNVWSRRIDKKNRLVYLVVSKQEIWILSCRYHYLK